MNAASKAPGPIVVAHDFTDSGDEALRQAHAWAGRVGAALEICHALPNMLGIAPLFPQSAAAAANSTDDLHYRAQEALWKRSASVLGVPENELKVTTVQGSPSAVIVEHAERLEASLVVVGASHAGEVRQFVLGSTAEQVVRHAHSDVLVAHAAAERSQGASAVVMVATDLSEHAMAAVEHAAAEARRRDAKLVAVHCLELAHPLLASFEPSLIVDEVTLAAAKVACTRTIESQLERVEGGGQALVVQGRAATAIAQAAEDRGAALLVVGTHGRTGLARFAIGSVASSIVRGTRCAVLIVRSTPGEHEG